MGQITITMNTNGDAFGENGSEPGYEVARILKDIAERVEYDLNGDTEFRVFDINGNAVGSFDHSED